MKKISKSQQAEIDDAAAACSKAADALREAIEAYNAAMAEPKQTLVDAIEAYNEKLEALKQVYSEIADEARSYYDERSERWQEGDAGQNYLEWVEALESPDFGDEVEIDLPDEIAEPDDLRSFTDPDEFPPDEPEG